MAEQKKAKALSAEQKAKRQEALSKPQVVTIIKYMAKAQVGLFRLTNGRIGSKWRIGAGLRRPVPTLLLDHVGRKSGTSFTTPLLYLRDGTNLVVVASQGGLPKNPQWYYNLLASPETTVHLKKQPDHLVRAHEADPEERKRLWPRLVDLYADFATYQETTDREIPVVVLKPR